MAEGHHAGVLEFRHNLQFTIFELGVKEDLFDGNGVPGDPSYGINDPGLVHEPK